MKNSKKLLILVLSLVMLIAACVMAASAESGEVATVVYPDGSEVTYAVGETIVAPSGDTYAGQGNTLYKNAGSGWAYSVDGAALADLTVTADMVGKTVVASGYDQVYFAVEVTGGETIYYTNAETANADFHAYVSKMNAAGSTTVLYSDITCGGISVTGKTESVYRLDLGGHKLTITSSTAFGAFDFQQNEFFLYSSKEGGVLDMSACQYAFHTNDGKYDGVRIDGDAYIGEYDKTRTDYGKNLTVYCKAIDNPTMHGSSLTLNGGTYVQAAGSTSEWFLQMGRTGSDLSHVQNVKNCTFVLTNAATSPLYLRCSSDRTYTNCTFISPSATGVALSGYKDMTKTHAFVNCNFFNVQPMMDSAKIIHNGSIFGGAIPAVPAGGVVAHGAMKTLEVLGESYSFDMVAATSTDSVMGINWGGVYTDYWAENTTPYINEAAFIYMEENADGSAMSYLAPTASDPSILGTVTADKLGKVVKAEVFFANISPVAFSWAIGEGAKGWVAVDGKTPLEIGQMFYDKFNECDAAYTIKLHADLELPAAMGWGPGYMNGNTPPAFEYNSLKSGDVTLDLNGFVFAVSADMAEGVNISNSNARSSYPIAADVIFGFEADAKKTFTLTSSLPGAKILNPTAFAFFGVGEGASANIVIDGANITYVGKGSVTHGFELVEASSSLTVNGGTYVVEGNNPAFSFNSKISIKDANIALLGDAPKSVFAAHNWKRNTSFTVENCVILAKNDAPLFGIIDSAYASAAPADAAKTYSLAFKDCSFAGVTLVSAITHLDSLTYEGFTKADTVENLLVAYGAQPEDTLLAKYNTALAYGEETLTATLLCYADAADVTTIVYGAGYENELYYVGSLFDLIGSENLADPQLKYEEGVCVVPEGYKGCLAGGVVTAEMAGNTYNAVDYINYVEKVLAFAVTVDGVVEDYAIIDSATAIEELLAALAIAPAGAEIVLFADVSVSEAIVIANSVTLDLGAKTLTVAAAFASTAPLTVKNGALVLTADVDALFGGVVAIEDVSVYNVAAEALLTNATATVTDAKVYNLTLGSAATLYGTVFHTDASASAFGAGVENVLYNNNVEVITAGGETVEISYTFVATDDLSKICEVSFVYKSVVRDFKKYFVGSIPASHAEAIPGYYYSYVGTEALTESCELACVFIIDSSTVMAQIVVTDALNFVFYLQKQDGISDVAFSGVAQALADAEIALIEGVEYYAFTVEFADLADALKTVSLAYNVNFGAGEQESIYVEISLLEYAESVFADAEVADAEKELVYAFLAYVESVLKYFGKDGAAEVKAFNKQYAEYATAFAAPAAREQITSDYVSGILYIVDEKVNMALHVDPEFKGEITVGTDLSRDANGNPVKGARFTYKDMVEIDGNTYFVLPDLAFSELCDEYTVEIRMYGEVVETFTYTLADYTVAMTEQNMGYTPSYVKALYTFATLAAAYAA